MKAFFKKMSFIIPYKFNTFWQTGDESSNDGQEPKPTPTIKLPSPEGGEAKGLIKLEQNAANDDRDDEKIFDDTKSNKEIPPPKTDLNDEVSNSNKEINNDVSDTRHTDQTSDTPSEPH